MYKFPVFFIAALLLQYVAQATIIRVNNNPTIQANYTIIDQAINAAASGDTIYIEGSATSYPAITLTKKLVLFGPGYFLNEASPNPNTQANPNTASIGSITFNAGSKYSVIQGLDLSGINLNDSMVTIQRCKLGGAIFLSPNRSIYADTLRDNFITGALYGGNYPCNTILLYNNIFTFYSIFSFTNQNNINGYMIHNSFTSTSSMNMACSNFVFQNNVFSYGISGSGLTTNVYFNNALAGTGIPATNGNVISINPNDFFIGTGSPDGMYKLKTNSPARNAGTMNGTSVDCGAYGGPAPYILSGMPSIPSIYQLSVPLQVPSGTTFLNVTFSAAAH